MCHVSETLPIRLPTPGRAERTPKMRGNYKYQNGFYTPLQYQRISLTDKQRGNKCFMTFSPQLISFPKRRHKRTRRKCEKTCCMCIARPLSRRPTQLTLFFKVSARTNQFFPDYSPRCLFQRALSLSTPACSQTSITKLFVTCPPGSVTSCAWSSNLAVCSRGI